MFRHFLLGLLFLNAAIGLSQPVGDTVYFDMAGKLTLKKHKAITYRYFLKEDTLVYRVSNYCRTHKPYYRGTVNPNNYQIWHGTYVYYNEKGLVEGTGKYINNKLEGEWRWYTKKDTLYNFYVNDELQGLSFSIGNNKDTLLKRLYRNNKAIYTDAVERKIQAGILLRGKLAGFVIIEDDWVLNCTAGAEYRFAKHHAIGAEYYFFRFRYEQEQYLDTTYTDYTEYSSWNPRHSVLMDYRFYIPVSLTRNSHMQPYVQAYYRFGNARVYHHEKYRVDSAGVFRQHEKFYDLGFTAGIHWAFLPRGRMGIDIQGGAFVRTKTEDIEHYNPGGVNWMEYGLKSEAWLPIVRVNFFYYLWHKK